VDPPGVRGFQWVLHIRRLSAGEPVIAIPEDRAPFGRVLSPSSIKDPSTIGHVPPASSASPLTRSLRSVKRLLGS